MAQQDCSLNQQLALIELSNREERLREQIDALECDLTILKKAKVIIVQAPISPKALITTNSDAYKNMSVGRATLVVLKEYPTKQWAATDLARELAKGGVRTKSVHFRATVNMALINLAKDGRVVRIPVEGLKIGSLYQLKQGERR